MLKFIIVNFVAVMGAAVGQWILGALVLAGAVWEDGQERAPEDAKAADKQAGADMLLTFGANIATFVVLLHMILLNGVYGIRGGAKFGFVAGLGLVAAPMLATYIYEKRPLRLFVVNAAYWVVALTISAVFLWRTGFSRVSSRLQHQVSPMGGACGRPDRASPVEERERPWASTNKAKGKRGQQRIFTSIFWQCWRVGRSCRCSGRSGIRPWDLRRSGRRLCRGRRETRRRR